MPNGESTSASATVRISIVLRTIEDREIGPDREAQPYRFWRHISRNIKNGEVSDNEAFSRLERMVVSGFGRRLRELLLTDYEDGPEYYRRGPMMREFGIGTAVRPSRTAFAFQVAGFRYGSLALDIDVTGIKALADFFDKNAALCEMVLAQYAPLALAYALTDNSRAYVDGLMSEVDAAALGPAFAALASTPVPPANPTTTAQQANPGVVGSMAAGLKWQWIAANTSLLVPVLLSLVVLYYGFVGLDHERERVWQAIKDLSEKQNEVLRIVSAKPPEPARIDGSPAASKAK
jgi:hypothetical protein